VAPNVHPRELVRGRSATWLSGSQISFISSQRRRLLLLSRRHLRLALTRLARIRRAHDDAAIARAALQGIRQQRQGSLSERIHNTTTAEKDLPIWNQARPQC